MLSPDVDVLILECCGPKEVGRCATASHGLRTAARVAWKSLATRKFPSLTSIAHAASQLPDAKPFDWASAFSSHSHLRVSPPRADDCEELWDKDEAALARIVVTYELSTRRMGSVDYEYEPFFVWSGRLSEETELWTSEQVPAEVRRWWDSSPPNSAIGSVRTRHTGEEAPNLGLRIYVTSSASKTVLLYSDGVNFGYEHLDSRLPARSNLYFVPKLPPSCPLFVEPPEDSSVSPDSESMAMEYGMMILPQVNIFDGRLEITCHLPDGVDEPDDGMDDAILRYVSNLDIDWLADPSSDYRGGDEDNYND